MRKRTLQFPIYTARQNINSSIQKSLQIPKYDKKQKYSFNLMKIINEDLKKMSQVKKKLPAIQNLFNSKQKRNKFSVQGNNKILSLAKKQKIVQSLNKKNQNQFRKKSAIQCSSSLSIRPNKQRPNTLQTRKNTIDLRMQSQKVIVVKKRQEFSKINEELIYDRRQNYLNSNFNKRKSRLNQITRVNKKIYERINSQRSCYSNDELNKSYESNASISKRLSNSKISARSRLSMGQQRSMNGSRCSIDSKKSVNKLTQLKHNKSKKNIIKIESKNVNEIDRDQVQKFASLFSNKVQNRQPHRSYRQSSKRVYFENISNKQIQQIKQNNKLRKENKENSDERKLPQVGRRSLEEKGKNNYRQCGQSSDNCHNNNNIKNINMNMNMNINNNKLHSLNSIIKPSTQNCHSTLIKLPLSLIDQNAQQRHEQHIKENNSNTHKNINNKVNNRVISSKLNNQNYAITLVSNQNSKPLKIHNQIQHHHKLKIRQQNVIRTARNSIVNCARLIEQ